MVITKNIRYLISRLLLFISIAILLVILISTLNKYGIRQALHDDVFVFDKSVTTLIAGDSHTETSLDPALLARSINISESSENYVYTYYKLHHFLAVNPQVNNIILGFSYHNISNLSESFLKDISGMDSYYLLLDNEGKALLDSSNLSVKLAKLKYGLGVPINVYKNSIGFKAFSGRHMNPSDYPFYGKFYGSQRCNINDKDLLNTVKRHYFNDSQQYAGTSKVNIEYLNRIAEMCSNKQINLFLFMSPLHKKYLDKIPLEAINNYNKVRIVLSQYNIIYNIDLSLLPLKDEWMGDGDHVNSLGAKVVSLEVQKHMNMLLDHKNRQYQHKMKNLYGL